MENIKYDILRENYYSDFQRICNEDDFGALLLPQKYQSNLWGTVVLSDEKLIGGWVGILRGNKPIVSFLAKGVWFDSYPIFTNEVTGNVIAGFVKYTKQEAKKAGIIVFNLTHWVRSLTPVECLRFDYEEKSATFLVDLKNEEDVLWQNTRKDFKNKILKKSKDKVRVFYAKGDDALKYLNVYQNLRADTQKRAIGRNSKASMLLKSNDYIANVIKNVNSVMFLAEYENEIIIANLMIQSGKTLYPYMSGSNVMLDNATGASALLRWEAIKYAKNIGLSYFDVGGVPVTPEKDHPAYGVYAFKKSIGGDYKEFEIGKIIISPFKYKLLNLLLKNRKLLRFISKNEK